MPCGRLKPKSISRRTGGSRPLTLPPAPHRLRGMEQDFPREIEALEGIFAFVRECFAAAGVDEDHAFDADLIIEELFTNMVKYNKDGSQPITIGIQVDPDSMTITLIDRGVHEFDLTQAPNVDTSLSAEDRIPGKLGIHFVRRIADDITYDYTDRTSRITVLKRWENQDV